MDTKPVTSLFGWTYNQYVYAVGLLRIRPEELYNDPQWALCHIQAIWYRSKMGKAVDPPTRWDGKDVEEFFVKVAREAWEEATSQSGDFPF